MKIDLEHDKAYIGFVFAGNNPEPNNHRWFVHFYAGDRVYSVINFDEAVIRAGDIKLGTFTWMEQTQFGPGAHGRVTLPPEASLVMTGGFRSKVFIGSKKDVEDITSPIWNFNDKMPFGTLKWNRQKNNWIVKLFTVDDEQTLEAQTLVLSKPRTYFTKVEEAAQPKVYFVFNFATMAEIESMGSTIVL
jgi:hypothetical protein